MGLDEVERRGGTERTVAEQSVAVDEESIATQDMVILAVSVSKAMY